MDLQTYLGEDEPVAERVPATMRTVAAVDGTLARTPWRVVFVSEGGVTDVALDSLDAVEFRDARYPLWNAVLGVVLSVLGGFLLAVASTGAGVPVTSVLGVALVLVGVGTLALGIRVRAATLELHTPARSYEFAGEEADLASFAGGLHADSVDFDT